MEFTGRVWGDLMDLIGIHRLLTSLYYPQGNGIIERSHHTVGNMVRAQLSLRDDRDGVDVLPGVMLINNEMEQENHGYTAPRIMWGKNVNLPTDLIHTPDNVGKSDHGGYAKNLGKELREIRKKVASFNRAALRPPANPFNPGDLILIYQQQMEKTHKSSPQWQGPFSVIKVPNFSRLLTLMMSKKKFHM